MRPFVMFLAVAGLLAVGVGSAAAQDAALGCSPIRFLSMRPEPIEGRPGATRFTFSGEFSAVCGDATIFADELIYEDDTRRVRAAGHVTFQQGDLSIYAERADLNWTTKLGSFYQASGTARVGAAAAERSPFGTQEPDIMFYGEEVARVGPRRFTLRGGSFTTCVQPTPRWVMAGRNATIAMDEYVLLTHMVFKVKDVPLLYLPGMYYPINKEDRSTGFLLPTYGASTFGGTAISNAFFWAISRSQDATFYHMWNSKLGQQYKAEYRYVMSAGSQGNVNFHVINEKVATTTSAPTGAVDSKRSYQLTGGMAQALPRGFYLNANANYFTDAASRQRFQNIEDYSQRNRSWSAAVAGTIGRLRVNASAEENDFFYGTTAGQRSGRLPTLNLTWSDRPIGSSRVYYGVAGESAFVVRQDNIADPATNRSLWRMDARPTIRAPLGSLPYLSATGQASWRVTRWFESIDPATGLQVPVALTRQLLEMNATVTGPVVSRVFQTPDNGYAERFKHVIEPSFRISRTTPFDGFDRVVINDYGIDGIVGGNTRITYRLSNRLLARRRGPAAAPGSPPAPGIAREILTVDLAQSYYSDARASQYDTEYHSGGSAGTAKGTYSPLTLSVTTRPTDSTTGQFRMDVDSKYRRVREYSAMGTLDAGRTQVSAGWSKRQVIPELPSFAPAFQRHFLNASTTLRTHDNRIGGQYGTNLDILNRSFLQQRVVAYYNSQCCGISFDWQQISTPLYNIPSDRRFGVSFTLSGIGSFSNPMGSFGGR